MSKRDLKAGYFKLGELCPFCKTNKLHVYPEGDKHCIICGEITVKLEKKDQL